MIEINFNEIGKEHIGQDIKVQADIVKVGKPNHQLINGVALCKKCGLGHRIREGVPFPKECTRCGLKNSFEIEYENPTTEFKSTQELVLGSPDSSKKIKALLNSYIISEDYQVGTTIEVVAEVKMTVTKNNQYHLYLNVFRLDVINETPQEISDDSSRNTPEYRTWQKEVINRDKVCQICGGSKHLEAHHMYSYKTHPKLRLDPKNGVVLCQFCHNKFHSYYGMDVTPLDLIHFIYQFRR